MANEIKTVEHLTIQVAVSIYSDQILSKDVRDILHRVGQRLSQEMRGDVETALTLELDGEPGEDWKISSTFVGASEHFHWLMTALIRDGRSNGLQIALTRLKAYREAATGPVDLDYIINMLAQAMESEK